MNNWEEWKPIFAMVGINIVYGVMNSVIKVVIDEGTNRLVYLTYQQLVAALFVAPVAYITERGTRPKLTGEILAYLFFSALLGATLINYFFLMGLQYTSATFACAFLNMTPVSTFLAAIPFRFPSLSLS
ncbi:WAT1-related protein At4g01440-like, partial [Asparagus officinalis]|uniref:WAT1-related protein At4g01440-like n=1 Tax=Asparagus officinalis TaxID=4686 RepID=UPI00098DE9C9